jgi:ACS family tartrate transporter-like MFS transporter
MITWGLAAIAMMFVRGERSFYALRFLLGAAEAGFFPGVVLYLGWWFPERERARAIALFMTATAIAGIVVGPISGALLMMLPRHKRMAVAVCDGRISGNGSRARGCVLAA